MYGWTGSFRVYYACSQKAWDRRFGQGPQYWIVVAKYRDGRLVRTKAMNRGYRPGPFDPPRPVAPTRGGRNDMHLSGSTS